MPADTKTIQREFDKKTTLKQRIHSTMQQRHHSAAKLVADGATLLQLRYDIGGKVHQSRKRIGKSGH
jgi:hypothetical protein